MYDNAGNLLGYELIEPDNEERYTLATCMMDIMHLPQYRLRAAYTRPFRGGTASLPGEIVDLEVWL